MRIGSLSLMLVACTFCNSTAVFAQPTHTAMACSARLNGPCGSESSSMPPTPATPLTAEYEEIIPPGGSRWYTNRGDVAAIRPFEFSGSTNASLAACSGTDILGEADALVRYEIDDETITFSRTDQPAAPGETVQVRVAIEYRFIATANGPPTDSPASGEIYFDYVIDWHNALPALQFQIGAVGFQGPMSSDTGWVTVTSGLATVPLGTPVPVYLRADSLFRIRLYTSPTADCLSMSGASSMQWRLTPQPFEFQGPGTYTADAPQLLIVNNTWPVSATACANTCADIDGSGGPIDLADFAEFAACFGLDPGTSVDCLCSDLNGDDLINLADFAIFAGLFGLTTTKSPPNCE